MSVGADVSHPARAPVRAETLRRTLGFRSTQVGLVLFLVVVGLALVGPYVAPYPTTSIEGAPYLPPNGEHWLGIDNLGRDAFSRFLAGGRTIIGLSVAATLLGFVGGIPIGLVAGYTRNWVDEILMRVGDIVMAFPAIILVLILVAGGGSSLALLVVAVAATHAPRIARVVRGATLEVVVREYVEAAEARGERTFTILRREVLPNIWSPIIVDFGIRLTASIILIASVSFLGFGLQPPTADWGLMINENRGALTIQPWPLVAPIVAIAVLTISVNLIGDGVARALGRSLYRRNLAT